MLKYLINFNQAINFAVAGVVVPKSFARPLFLSGNDEMGPSLDDVVELLGKNDIAVDSKKFEVIEIDDLIGSS